MYAPTEKNPLFGRYPVRCGLCGSAAYEGHYCGSGSGFAQTITELAEVSIPYRESPGFAHPVSLPYRRRSRRSFEEYTPQEAEIERQKFLKDFYDARDSVLRASRRDLERKTRDPRIEHKRPLIRPNGKYGGGHVQRFRR